MSSCSLVVDWTATKTYLTALYLNDTMLVSGSSAGLVKLWSLAGLLASPPLLAPLRRISMKVNSRPQILSDVEGDGRYCGWGGGGGKGAQFCKLTDC